MGHSVGEIRRAGVRNQRIGMREKERERKTERERKRENQESKRGRER